MLHNDSVFTPNFARPPKSARNKARHHQVQWLGESGYRLRIRMPLHDQIVYVDPDFFNSMMPAHLKRQIRDLVVPDDANLIVIT